MLSSRDYDYRMDDGILLDACCQRGIETPIAELTEHQKCAILAGFDPNGLRVPPSEQRYRQKRGPAPRCPACLHRKVVRYGCFGDTSEKRWYCLGCGNHYRIVDGVPVMARRAPGA